MAEGLECENGQVKVSIAREKVTLESLALTASKPVVPSHTRGEKHPAVLLADTTLTNSLSEPDISIKRGGCAVAQC